MLLVLLSAALAYEPVKNIKFSQFVETKSLKINNDILEYSFYRREKTAYPKDLMEAGILEGSYLSLREINKIKPNAKPCRPNEYLEIYEVSLDQLNDGKRFSSNFFSTKGVWGYFDPRPNESRINSILVTPHSLFDNFQIITHEIAHHWYSVYCLDEYTLLSSEEFAIHIQFSLESKNVYN